MKFHRTYNLICLKENIMFLLKIVGYIIFLVFLFLGTLYTTNTYNRNIESIDFYYQMTSPYIDGFTIEDGLKLLDSRKFVCSVIASQNHDVVSKKYLSPDYTAYQCYKVKIYPHLGWNLGFISLRGNYVSNIYFTVKDGKVSFKEQYIENGNVL